MIKRISAGLDVAKEKLTSGEVRDVIMRVYYSIAENAEI